MAISQSYMDELLQLSFIYCIDSSYDGYFLSVYKNA